MKKNLKIFSGIFILSVSFLVGDPLYAEDKAPAPKESLMNSGFVMETDDQSSAESLERISGKIDTGFSAPENTYKTEERPGAGPFAKEKAEEKKQTTAAY